MILKTMKKVVAVRLLNWVITAQPHLIFIGCWNELFVLVPVNPRDLNLHDVSPELLPCPIKKRKLVFPKSVCSSLDIPQRHRDVLNVLSGVQPKPAESR